MSNTSSKSESMVISVIDLPSPFDELGYITWIKMFDVNDILNQNFFTIQVTTDQNYIRLQHFYSDVRRNETDRCYMFNRNGTANDIAIKKSMNFTALRGTTFHYHFKYLPPSKHYWYDDIQYNVKKAPMGVCEFISFRNIPKLRYFRANSTYNETGQSHNALTHSESQLPFYNSGDNLVDIKKVWQTGVVNPQQKSNPGKCQTTGSVSPHFNPDIKIPCHG